VAVVRWLIRIAALAATLVLLAPYLVYWFGLTLVSRAPAPTGVGEVPEEVLLAVWAEHGGQGTPRLGPVGPWGYLRGTFCYGRGLSSQELRESPCGQRYPGLRHAGFAVKEQVRSALETHADVTWILASVSYTIKASQTWSIEEVLSTLASEQQASSAASDAAGPRTGDR
jgi:hypothetical protein